MKIDRLVSIIMTLLNKERTGAQELADMFEVSPRTIYRDIDAINMAGIPVRSIPGVGGGFEIMLASDIRVASSQAVFALPEVSLGIVPAGGTLVRLARQIPYIRAMELILMGEKISAKTALDYGVLNHVVAPKDVMDKAMEIAKKFCTLSTTAVQTAKESVLKLREIPLEQAFETEALLGYKAFTSEDAKEGLASFYDKRKPEFPSRKW